MKAYVAHKRVRMRERELVLLNREKGCARFPEKFVYRHRGVAQLAAAHQSKELGHKVYLYRCPTCKGFHLSRVRAR